MKHLHSLTDKNAFYVLSGIALLIHFRILFNGFVGDDTQQIYNFGLVRSALDLPRVFFYHHSVLGSENAILGAYYKPLMLFYFYTIRLFFGLHPFFYHLPQLILITINSFLIYLLFKKFLRRELCIFLSIIFLIHPINQETAAYISNIQDVLFFFFGILALLLIDKSKSYKHFILTGVLLLLSLLSKESGILFLLICALFLLLFQKKILKTYVPILITVLFSYFLLRVLSRGTSVFWIEPSPMSTVSFPDRLRHTPVLFFYYIKTFFYPTSLTFNQQWILTRISPLIVILHTLMDGIILGIICISNYLLFKKKSPYYKTFLFFSVWFMVGLLPHLQLLPLDATVADRWFYFSSVGLLGIIGIGIEIFLKYHVDKTRIVFCILLLICLLLGLRTIIRNIEWTDAFSLYSHDATLSKSALLENNLGDEYFKMNDFKNAEKHFKNALLINPGLWIAINNIGIIKEKNGDLKSALIYYKRAYKSGERLPVAENIARVLVIDKRQKEAIAFLNTTIKTYPLSAKLLLTLSLAYYDLKEYKNAKIYADKSYDLDSSPQALQVIQAIEEMGRK